VRLISATNRDLQSLVEKKQFREDIYYRLNIFLIAVPPLRERKNDIPSLVQYFIEKKAQEMVLTSIPAIAPGEIDRMMQYDWPGNVRELENAVEKAIILARGNYLRFDHIIGVNTPKSRQWTGGAVETRRLDELEALHIEAVLSSVGGRVSGKGGAADLLGINPNTLRHRMRKMGIPFGRVLGRASIHK
jgi:DNA-binding NtrC family response regulator